MTDGPRDLACDELWQQSIARSRARREARERHMSFGPVDPKRVVVPAALLAGGLAVGEVVTSSGGSGGGTVQDATAASATAPAPSVAAERRPVRSATRSRERERSTAEKPERRARPKKRRVVVVRSVAQAQALGGFKRGMRGAGVVALQRQLGVAPDGIYGTVTLRAVHRAQKGRGLDTDGIVGPATWRALSAPRSSSTTRPAVQRRSKRRTSGATVRAASSRTKRGLEVEALQAKLGLPVDGDFGARTLATVKRFQRRNGLKADGVVGPATWRALGLSSSNRTVHPHKFGTSKRSGGRSSGGRRSGGGSGGGTVARAIAAANRIATKPYRYGGGHGSFEDSGYDCSGSVSYVLHGAGLLSTPLDSSGFMSYGAAGPGKHITIYANPGHVFMTINGRRFDTGYGGNGNRWASGSRPTGGYTVRHPPGL